MFYFSGKIDVSFRTKKHSRKRSRKNHTGLQTSKWGYTKLYPRTGAYGWSLGFSSGVTDMSNSTVHVGNTKKIVSAQSLIKVILYAYALEKGTQRFDISLNEAVGLPFNQDPIMLGHAKTAGHPLNNAGALSCAASISDWDDFLTFARRCFGHQNIGILEEVYTSEKSHRENNMKLSASLAAAGRYPANRIQEVLEMYTKACSLGISVDDALHAGSILMNGGFDEHNNRILQHNTCVLVINAMNSFGLYEESSRMNLMIAGTKALAAKSSVSGFVLRVNPFASCYVTLGHHLDMIGNSVFGILAAKMLNSLLVQGDALRLDGKSQEDFLERYLDKVEKFTKETSLARIDQKVFCRHSCLLTKEDVFEMISESKQDTEDILTYIDSCFKTSKYI